MEGFSEGFLSYRKFSLETEKDHLESQVEQKRLEDNLELDNLLFQGMNSMRNQLLSSKGFKELKGGYNKFFEM
jgi:hypothetical protein